MLTMIIIILLIGLIFNLIKLALKLAWGMAKMLAAVIFLPLLILGIALAGYVYISLIILIVMSLIGFITNLFAGTVGD